MEVLDQVALAAGDQKLLVNRRKIITVLAKCMTEGNSEQANGPCHQCAVKNTITGAVYSYNSYYGNFFQASWGNSVLSLLAVGRCSCFWYRTCPHGDSNCLKIAGFPLRSWVFLPKTSCRPNILLCTLVVEWSKAIMYAFIIHLTNLKYLNTRSCFPVDLYF